MPMNYVSQTECDSSEVLAVAMEGLREAEMHVPKVAQKVHPTA